MNTPEKPVPIAIIGMGCMFPNANDSETYWANIRDGVDSIREIPDTHWNPADYFDENPNSPDHVYARTGGFLDSIPFNPLDFGIAPNAIEATDTAQLLGLVIAQKALESAGYDSARSWDRSRVSVILGVTGTLELVIPLGARLSHPVWRRALESAGVDPETSQDVIRRISHAFVDWQESSFPGLLGNVVAGRIANRFDFGGSNCVVDAACASSLSAIHMACMELIQGRADMVVSGGVDTFNDIFMYMCFAKTKALSPTGHAKPFDKNGDGTILGEGIGLLVLKRLDDAIRDQNRILAVIKSIGSASDGKGQAIYAPSPKGQIKALERAYELAGITPDTIELIEAHGTGTKIGDAIEVEALTSVFRNARPDGSWCALGSVKSQIGHTKAAAGVAGLIKAVLALNHHVLPPTIKVNQPLPQLELGRSPFYINTSKRPWIASKHHPRRAGVSSFGFGGSNYHCVLEEYPQPEPLIDWNRSVELLAFSDSTVDGLIRQIHSLQQPDSWEKWRDTAAELRSRFHPQNTHRLTITADQSSSMAELLKNAVSAIQLQSAGKNPERLHGIHYCHGPVPGKLGIIFPGQGTQYTGMLRDMACHFPQFQDVLTHADAAFTRHHIGENRLIDFIYPHPVFSPELQKKQETELTNTAVAQPAIGAVSLGAFQVLSLFGLTPDAAAGHSYGELCALCVAGSISQDDFHHLSGRRGLLMGTGDGDRGSMAAVQAPLDEIQRILTEEKLDLLIANKNAPSQGVISGATSEIERALTIFKSRNMRISRLPVSAAFHSPLVADAAKPFADALESISFHSPRFPVYSNTTGQAYPDSPDSIRAILSRHLEHPVEFTQEILAMHDAGIVTFLEIGPGNRMTGLIRNILDGRPFHASALDTSGGRKNGVYELADTIARLSALGYSIDLTAWNPIRPPSQSRDVNEKKPAMTIPICGANYVRPKPELPPVPKQARNAQPTPPVTPSVIDVKRNPAVVQPVHPISSEVSMTHSSKPRTDPSQSPVPPSRNTTHALNLIQENLIALQRIQEQTAELHRRFLENQEYAQKNFQILIQQHFQILTGQPCVMNTPNPVPHEMIPTPQQPIPTAAPSSGVPESIIPSAGHPVPDAPPESRRHPDVRKPPAPSDIPPSDRPNKTVGHVLLETVSEKTGYPRDILHLDMELDADLGIDSIKRVEILSVLQERHPHLPVLNPEDLGAIRTLNDIVRALTVTDPDPSTAVSAHTGHPSAGSSPVIRMDAVLEIIAEKTGYPIDILNPEMELDADLGIDSIKRVEILSALQERHPHLPALNPEDLGSLRTVNDIAHKISPHTARSGPGSILPEPPHARSSSDIRIDSLLAVISEKTGYPVDILNPEMELDADLGIDSIKRVEILSAIQERFPGAYTPSPEEIGVLRTIHDVHHLINSKTEDDPHKSPHRIELPTDHSARPVPSEPSRPDAAQSNPVPGVIRSIVRPVRISQTGGRTKIILPADPVLWITGDPNLGKSMVTAAEARHLPAVYLDLNGSDTMKPPENLAGLIVITPESGIDHAFLKQALFLVQRVGVEFQRHSGTGNPVLVGISRLNGSFGFDSSEPVQQPISGGLAGIIKTAAWEWPNVRCKAIDMASTQPDPLHPGDILDEILTEGPIEIGISADGKYELVLTEEPLTQVPSAPWTFDPSDVILVTGGGRGITADVSRHLAASWHMNVILLGRTPVPVEEPEWLAPIHDESEIKRAISLHAPQPLNPRDLQKRFDETIRNREIQATIERIRKTGVSVEYISVDIREPDSVSACLSAITRSGRTIRGLIHGAGVLADRLIGQKTPEDVNAVYDTKVIGLENILTALDPANLRFLVMFSSSTARFGRKGQVDYAMANEVLNKLAQSYAIRYPLCRTLSVNWGPWDGGMVTDSLKSLFLKEGIHVIGLHAGAQYLLQELATTPEPPARHPVEVVVLGPKSTIPMAIAHTEPKPGKPAIQLAVELSRFPVLAAHVIKGKPVVPMALMIEWSAVAAMHAHPGLRYIGFNHLNVLKGIILEPDGMYHLQFFVGKATPSENEFVVPVEIHGMGPNGQTPMHARSDVVLASVLPPPPDPDTQPVTEPYPHHRSHIYQNLLFHGDVLAGIQQIRGISSDHIIGNVRTAPGPSEWISQPIRNRWITEPLVLDSGFQMVILWCLHQLDAPSLPCGIRHYRQYQSTFPSPSRVSIHITSHPANHVQGDMLIQSDEGAVIATMSGFEFITDPSLKEAFKDRTLPAHR